MMKVQHHSRISLFLVAVDYGDLDQKYKSPVVYESKDNNRKSEIDLTYNNNMGFQRSAVPYRFSPAC